VEQSGSVLLVGENDVFKTYADFLQTHGLVATVARSPGDALLEVVEAPPDVVVTDIAFGGQTRAGCRFITAVRQEPLTHDTIIIVVSRSGRRAARQLARQCGADWFFSKPLLPEALLEEVLDAIAHRREQRRPEWNGPTRTGERRRLRRKN
jgi:CheY-like chemotaxis protein